MVFQRNSFIVSRSHLYQPLGYSGCCLAASADLSPAAIRRTVLKRTVGVLKQLPTLGRSVADLFPLPKPALIESTRPSFFCRALCWSLASLPRVPHAPTGSGRASFHFSSIFLPHAVFPKFSALHPRGSVPEFQASNL